MRPLLTSSFIRPMKTRNAGRFGRNFTGAGVGVRLVGAAADNPMRKGKTIGRSGGVHGLGDEAEDQIAQLDAAAAAVEAGVEARGDEATAVYDRDGRAAYDAHQAGIAPAEAAYGRPVTAVPTTPPVLRPRYSDAGMTVEAPRVTKSDVAPLKSLSKQVETKIASLIADNGSLTAAAKVMAAKDAVVEAKAANVAAVTQVVDAKASAEQRKMITSVAVAAGVALALYLVLRK